MEYDAYLKTAHCHERDPIGSYCHKIDNCSQTVCFKSRDPGTAVTDTWSNKLVYIKSTVGCRVCNPGYIGIDFDNIWDTGSSSCIKKDDDNKKIKNCLLIQQSDDNNYECVQCNKGYAVLKHFYLSYFTTERNVVYTSTQKFLDQNPNNKY